MKMKKTVFMKVLALLFVGTGALAYSYSGDDIFEEEEALEPILSRNIIKLQITDNHILSKV